MSAYFRSVIKHCLLLASKCKFELNFTMFFVPFLLARSLAQSCISILFLYFHAISIVCTMYIDVSLWLMSSDMARQNGTQIRAMQPPVHCGLFAKIERKGTCFVGMFYFQTEFLHDCVANIHRNLQWKSIFRYKSLFFLLVCAFCHSLLPLLCSFLELVIIIEGSGRCEWTKAKESSWKCGR